MVTRAALVLAGSIALGCRGNSAPQPAAGSGSAPAPVAAAPVPDAAPADARPVPVPPAIARGVKLVPIARGLARPVLVVAAPGSPDRLFVVEQHAGRVRILDHGALLPRPFLEIRGVSKGEEQGLLGLAFHPQYATNGKLYVNYTGADGATHIVAYQVSADPTRVDPASRKELVEIAQPYANHNGGNLVFGPDGELWTGMGDGGAAGDPHGNGQNPDALLGKLLRFDVDAAKPVPERVHLGLRNPWRFAFDATTHDLFIADVGQDKWENIYVVEGDDHAQHNFGWNVVEGAHCYKAKTCDRAGFTPPVVDYPHPEGCSVTGGVVYRGKALPALAGAYFYADFCTNLLRSFRWANGAVHDHWDWKQALDPQGELAQTSSFGVDLDGEVYVVSLTGTIYKLVPAA